MTARYETQGEAWRLRQGRGNKPRPPLRTFKECAEMLGVSERELCGHLASDPSAPKSVLVHKSATHKAKWFNPSEMRSWWAKRAELAPRNVHYARVGTAKRYSEPEFRPAVSGNVAFPAIGKEPAGA